MFTSFAFHFLRWGSLESVEVVGKKRMLNKQSNSSVFSNRLISMHRSWPGYQKKSDSNQDFSVHVKALMVMFVSLLLPLVHNQLIVLCCGPGTEVSWL